MSSDSVDGDMDGQLLDSGRQAIYAIYDVRLGELVDWLKHDLVGFRLEESGEVITGIDTFQVLGGNGPYYSCIALVRIGDYYIDG